MSGFYAALVGFNILIGAAALIGGIVALSLGALLIAAALGPLALLGIGSGFLASARLCAVARKE